MATRKWFSFTYKTKQNKTILLQGQHPDHNTPRVGLGHRVSRRRLRVRHHAGFVRRGHSSREAGDERQRHAATQGSGQNQPDVLHSGVRGP
jgi:hypothetical protein